MPRRGLSFEEGLRQAQTAAWRRHGRKHPYLFIILPYLPGLIGWLLAVAALFAAWYLVPHQVLGMTAAALGAAPLLVLGVRAISGSGLRRRMMNRARSITGPRRGMSPAVAMGGFSVIMLAASALALVSPWA